MEAEVLIRARCSEEEKKDLLKIVVLMTAIAAKCHRDGILSIGEISDVSDIPFLKIAVKLIINGYDTPMISTILENIIHAENNEGKNILEKILIYKAIKIIISEGTGSSMVKTFLLYILGEKWLCDFSDSDVLNKEISRMIYRIAYKSDCEKVSPELINKAILEWMEGSTTYATLYNALHKLLKSQAFLTPIASIYLLYENKEVFDEWIDSNTEKILKCVDDLLTAKIIVKTRNIDFIDVRTDIRGKLSTLILYGFINFERNAKLALERIMASPAIPAHFKTEHVKSNLSYNFVWRVCEFMKALISSIDKSGKCFDFQACKDALIKIVAERKSAEEVQTK